MIRKQWLFVLVLLLCGGLLPAAHAQNVSGFLTVGQPAASPLAPGQTLVYGYSVLQPSSVVLLAFGDAVQPAVTIKRDGAVVTSAPNADALATLTLNAFLSAGTYQVEVSTVGTTSGTVVVLVQSETPVTSTPLLVGGAASGAVSQQSPQALYTFSALPEQSILTVESGLPDRGATIRLTNTTTGTVSGILAADLAGGSFAIPAGAATYQVEVSYGGAPSGEPYALCLETASVQRAGTSACSGGAAGQTTAPITTPEVISQPPAACTVKARDAGGANIRQSATTSSIILASLPGVGTAQVLGISPDGTFYNIQLGNINGWVSLSVVVVASGPCDGVPVINPPPIIAAPTAVPPTVPPAAPPTASGPCLITITSPTYIYTQTTAIPDYLFDQAQAGYQLIPIGRLADNSWWKTNYYDSWIQTSTFGSTANVTGDCSGLPVVSP